MTFCCIITGNFCRCLFRKGQRVVERQLQGLPVTDLEKNPFRFLENSEGTASQRLPPAEWVFATIPLAIWD
jgi:hypothetical protein